jgi:mono/diheme cytochrome c family protein
MSTRSRTILLVLAAPFAAYACGGDDNRAAHVNGHGDPGKKASPVAAKQAQELFQSLCSTCHGTTGKGDGPGSIALDPKPRSFADAAWQASVTDDHIKKVILFGGAVVGKSPVMPASPQLKTQPEVLEALLTMVRAFRPQ